MTGSNVSADTRPFIIGVCSSGGHLIQMESLIKMGVPIGCVLAPDELNVDRTWVRIPDCNLRSPLRILRCTATLVTELRRLRPGVIVSTGAAPGGIAIAIGRIFGCKTVWIDSIANAEKASLTGRLVKPLARIWISQWKSVAEKERGIYIGKIFRFFDGGNAASV